MDVSDHCSRDAVHDRSADAGRRLAAADFLPAAGWHHHGGDRRRQPLSSRCRASRIDSAVVDQHSRRFWPGRVGQCYDPGNQPLVFSSKGNLSPREVRISFWLQPQFRGADKGLYCTFVSATPWGMFYKYLNQSSLTFATAKPEGDWYYNCGIGDIGSWQPSQWHHVAACWSRQGNFRQLYLNLAGLSSFALPAFRGASGRSVGDRRSFGAVRRQSGPFAIRRGCYLGSPLGRSRSSGCLSWVVKASRSSRLARRSRRRRPMRFDHRVRRPRGMRWRPKPHQHGQISLQVWTGPLRRDNGCGWTASGSSCHWSGRWRNGPRRVGASPRFRGSGRRTTWSAPPTIVRQMAIGQAGR